MGTSSNGPGSSIKIELGSKEAENYYNRKDNSINNDYCQQVNIYDDVEEEPIYDSEEKLTYIQWFTAKANYFHLFAIIKTWLNNNVRKSTLITRTCH